MAKPVSGEWIEDEFSGLKQLGINKIVSLLEPQEQYEVGLDREEELCTQYNMAYSSFPIPDRGLPNTNLALQFADKVFSEISKGSHTAIHCRAGIGRTGLIAGTVLVRAGFDPVEAIQMISEARGVRVPDTEEQENWLLSLSETSFNI